MVREVRVDTNLSMYFKRRSERRDHLEELLNGTVSQEDYYTYRSIVWTVEKHPSNDRSGLLGGRDPRKDRKEYLPVGPNLMSGKRGSGSRFMKRKFAREKSERAYTLLCSPSRIPGLSIIHHSTLHSAPSPLQIVSEGPLINPK